MSAPRESAAFQTSDMWLAAAVVAVTQARVAGVDRTPRERRAVFLLEGAADAERIAADFRGERLTVNATALMRAVRRLKSELYDGRR